MRLKSYRQGKFEEAIKFYQTVPENDTNFTVAVTENMLAYNQLKQYDKTVKIGEKILKERGSDLIPSFYLNYGVSLDMLKRYDETQYIYDSALKKYPLNYKIHYNKGVSFELSKNLFKLYKYNHI